MEPMPNLEQRQALCDGRVTLNGKPAKVTGYRHEFATVAQFHTGLSAEWSWQAVARVRAKGGRFEA